MQKHIQILNKVQNRALHLICAALSIVLLHIKSIYSEEMFLWWYYPLYLYKTSLSFVIVTLLATYPYGSDVTIQIFYISWWRYSYLTQSSIAEFSYLTPISILPLKPLLRAIYWNPKYLLYLLLIYKTSSYTIICYFDNWQR